MYYHYLLHGGGGATDTRFPTPEKKEKKNAARDPRIFSFRWRWNEQLAA